MWYLDIAALLKKLQELAALKKDNPAIRQQPEALRKVITLLVTLKKIIDRGDARLTDQEESEFKTMKENPQFGEEENFLIELIFLTHTAKNKKDLESHLLLTAIFIDYGVNQKAADYCLWVIKSNDPKFLGAAYYYLGTLYSQGKIKLPSTVKNRFDIAIKCFEKAASNNWGVGYFSLGYIYEQKRDFLLARKYYMAFIKTCDPQKPGSTEAQHAMYRCAKMGELGLGMEKDLIEAKKIYSFLVTLYSHKQSMFDLAEILFEEKEFTEAKKLYNQLITADKAADVDQDIALNKMEALYKLELIETTEKAAAAEKRKQKKLQKKLDKAKTKEFEKPSKAVETESMLLMADTLLRDKKYKDAKKQFLAAKSTIFNENEKINFLTLDEKNIIYYVKCLWGVGNCLFGLNKLAGANNIYKEALVCIQAYVTNHNEIDELITIRYSIEVDIQAIAVKLNLESSAETEEQTEVSKQKELAVSKTIPKKSKKKKKPLKLPSIFGSEVEREVLNVVIPDRAMLVLNILKEYGTVPYIFGGFIRDSLLKIAAADIDIISKTLPEVVKNILETYFNKNAAVIDPRLIPLKISLKKYFHAVVVEYHDGEHIDIVTFRDYDDKSQYDPNKFGDFETHARTFDLTINGLLLDPFTKQIIDKVGGLADIRAKKLRVNDPKVFFKLDPSRMLRSVRFAAQFPDFEIVDRDKIFEYMDDYGYYLNDRKKITKGKLFVEISDLFSHGRGLATYKMLKPMKLLPFLFPHFSVLKSQGYLETKFFSFDKFIEKVLQEAKDAPKPEWYALPLLLAVILWPLLLEQYGKCNKQFESAQFEVRNLQPFDIPENVWRATKLIWVIHFYKTVSITQNNSNIHFMAETFSKLAAEADAEWKDMKKMFAEKKQQELQYSQISRLPEVFSLFSTDVSDVELNQESFENTF